jgi:hypothetical protein
LIERGFNLESNQNMLKDMSGTDKLQAGLTASWPANFFQCSNNITTIGYLLFMC